jgi:hypothetical protein
MAEVATTRAFPFGVAISGAMPVRILLFVVYRYRYLRAMMNFPMFAAAFAAVQSLSLQSAGRSRVASFRMASETASICDEATLQDIRAYIREHKMAVKTAGAGRSKKPIIADMDQMRHIRAYDYSCIARGQVFVAPNWLSRDLLNALRAHACSLLEQVAFSESGLIVSSKDGFTTLGGYPAGSGRGHTHTLAMRAELQRLHLAGTSRNRALLPHWGCNPDSL